MGGRLSSLLLMQTRRGNPEKFNITGGISTISSRVSVDGPIIKNKLTFLASGRIAYPNLILGLFPKILMAAGLFFMTEMRGWISRSMIKIASPLQDIPVTMILIFRKTPCMAGKPIMLPSNGNLYT
jgi:hypothetical protein